MKLTHLAAEIRETDVDVLRGQGLDDAAISDAIQVVSYFNYVTRVADGVGIEDEPEWTDEVTAGAEGAAPIHTLKRGTTPADS